MTSRIEFGLSPASLVGSQEPSATFAYSYWFVPLDNTGKNGRPVLTRTQFLYLAMTAGVTDGLEALWESWHGDDEEGNQTHTHTMMERGQPRGSAGPVGGDETSDDPYVAFISQRNDDVLTQLMKSELGFLFLDRTRIVPQGFVVGEHLYTLALAAAEEVVLEQRSFKQLERVDEATTEGETTTESETVDSWTNDDAVTTVGSGTSAKNDGFTAGGSVGFDYGIKAGVQGNYAKGTTEADTESRTVGTKDVHVNSTKAVGKMRDQHKTVFRLSSTSRFEDSARRTIRNPNQHTPIDLHIYKILQRMRFSHERFGARLCWTPWVKDPAGDFFQAEADMRATLVSQAEASVPPYVGPPQPPNLTDVPGTVTVGLSPPLTELTAWGGWPGKDMSHDYTLPINMPANMKWDGDTNFVERNLKVTLTGSPRSCNKHMVGNPWEIIAGNGTRTLLVIVHVGAGWSLTGSTQLWVSMSAQAIPDATSLAAASAAAIAAWEATRAQAIAERSEKVAVAKAAALVTFEAWRAEHRASLDPAQELLRRFINAMFPLDSRDEIHELDRWEQAFDWDLASARTYSGTWSGAGMLRDDSLPAADFVNASFARLYLPVRPGFEQTALQAMMLRSQRETAPQAIADLIAGATEDLKQWRIDNLGGEEEVKVTLVPGHVCPDIAQQYICLGTWTDDLPTDGVHMEVTQAMTTAADETTAALADAAVATAESAALVTAAGVEFREALAAADLSAVGVEVNIDQPGD